MLRQPSFPGQTRGTRLSGFPTPSADLVELPGPCSSEFPLQMFVRLPSHHIQVSAWTTRADFFGRTLIRISLATTTIESLPVPQDVRGNCRPGSCIVPTSLSGQLRLRKGEPNIIWPFESCDSVNEQKTKAKTLFESDQYSVDTVKPSSDGSKIQAQGRRSCGGFGSYSTLGTNALVIS